MQFQDSHLSISVFQALHGDALHIRFFGSDSKYHNIYIDGGFAKTYKATLQPTTKKLLDNGEKIDLFVITHTDRDHISGVLSFISEFGALGIVDEYWFNHSNLGIMLRFPSDKISIGDGIRLRDFLSNHHLLPNIEITNEVGTLEFYGAILTILSPSSAKLRSFQQQWSKKEDKRDPSSDKIVSTRTDYQYSIAKLAQNQFREDIKLENGSSIAFLFKLRNTSALFLADSHPSVVIQSLQQLGYSPKSKLKVDYVKLSHHGSKANTSDELLSLLDCSSFIISANGRNRYHFPHKETLAKILLHSQRDFSKHIEFIFNYDNSTLRSMFTNNDYATLNFSCRYPPKNKNAYTIY